MYTRDNIFPVLPIKDLITEYGKATMPFRLATGTEHSFSHLCVLLLLYDVRKAAAHVEKKVLNMPHQAKKGFCGIFVGIPQHQKGYLLYVPSKKETASFYDVIFDESFSSSLAYTPQPYAEAMDMLPAVSYTPCDACLVSTEEFMDKLDMF